MFLETAELVVNDTAEDCVHALNEHCYTDNTVVILNGRGAMMAR